ncbi:MAG: sporulation protein YunB [Clostridia bacterium]|nr:sporulation protein YunB [Clostridia bacterium]
MRIKYYRLSLRQMKSEKSFVLFFILLIIFSSITTLYIQVIEPVLLNFTKSNAYTLAMKSTEEAIRQNLSDITYDSIVNEILNENGNIIGLRTNTKELNRISNSIAIDIENNIANIESGNLRIPIGLFFNTGLLGGAGIRVNIKTVPLGDTKIDCISQFDSVGINQTRHRIILKIKTCFTIIAPLYVNDQFYEKEVVMAETILNGEIPNTYYHLDLTEEADVMNLLE